jgi:uncharacterized tellurite resistance protein B-like protein
VDEDFTVDQLKLAFTYHIVNQILESDDEVVPAEARFLRRTFPQELFESSGFVDAEGKYTQRWQDALGEALLELPVQLSVAERLKVLETFYQAAVADDDFQYIEGNILVRAAKLLGLRPEQFTARLEQLIGTGSIDLPAPEFD